MEDEIKLDRESFKALYELDVLNLFLFIWLAVMMLAARGGIRLFIVLAPVASLFVAFLILQAFSSSGKIKDLFYKALSFLVILLIVVPMLYADTSRSYLSVKQSGPSYDQQWREAMSWVRESTPQDAVFAHWWDYGYWVQTGGGRATVTD